MSIWCIIPAKNEQDCIGMAVSSVAYHCRAIVWDDYSTDQTVHVASEAHAHDVKTLPRGAGIRDVGFGQALNNMIKDVPEGDWILILDADEILSDSHLLAGLIKDPTVEAWALPRRKWLNWEEKIREEYEAYPDWQPKFFKKTPYNRFEGMMHIRFTGSPVKYAYRGPHIEHLQSQNRDPVKIEQRRELYTKLASLQGVAIDGGHVLPVSQKE